ncbi:MAG: alcohol-forming fatty acyl-CoA reductase [Solirubrobacteraceae bacterium]|nr:alcohol-forming fatty acyl-CoA reductase [Solirubrobacteraceae bacterium]
MPPLVAAKLAGAQLLLTGATGFLGKAVLATWLREVPEAGTIVCLVRAADDDAAQERLEQQVLTSEPFAGGLAEKALAAGRLRAIAADLAIEGALDPAKLAGTDVAIHCAASVSFEQPLDDIIELNVLGARRLASALREAGCDDVHLLHVSTAYAAGQRTGLVLERPYGSGTSEPWVDLDAELTVAKGWRRELESQSRLPEQQKRFVADAQEELGPAGALHVGQRAEWGRHGWMWGELVERGRQRARALGWSDTYTLSKALAERALVQSAPKHLTILRPTIIESALEQPYPGWIEGLKVTDPVLLAYGRGLIPRFPGEPSARIDIVPVDLVAHALVAAAADPPTEGPRCLTMASGARNPLRIGELAPIITRYFRAHPLPDEDGVPVEVGEWRFASHANIRRALDRGEQALGIGRRLLGRAGLPNEGDVERTLHKQRRSLERLRRLSEIYGPYTELDCAFDDRETRALAERMDPEDRTRLPFDTAAIDWESYIADVHLPALRRLVSTPRPARSIAARRATVPQLPEGPAAIAFFDVEGVVLDATIVHAYAWLRTREMPHPDRELWLLSLGARTTAFRAKDRVSRAAFNREFYQRYAGLPARELRDQAADALSDLILPRMHHAAVRRIRQHRARGDRVVLLTGALDFLVEPLRHLADDLVAARLVERAGAFTGELAEPPLTADGRASLAAAFAADHGVPLAECHAYGDAISDLPMLEVVGHPHAVNPDFRLAREARRRHWPVERWAPEPGARTAPPAAVVG